MTSMVPQSKAAVEIKNQTGKELNATANAASAQTKIQAAMMMALNRPRDEKKFKDSIIAACADEDFAEDAIYSFPRGDSQVEGLSVNIAREMARLWGNLHYGVDVVGEDENTRQIRGWAWDLETGAMVTLDDAFAKMVYTKRTGWQKADERNLRELNNRRAAILERNCILKLIPPPFKKSAEKAVKETLKRVALAAPEQAVTKMVAAFSTIGVTEAELEKYLGHKVGITKPEEIVKLKGVYKSIIDGNSRWDEYVTAASTTEEAMPRSGVVDVEAIKASAEQNRGHGNEGLEGLAQQPQEAAGATNTENAGATAAEEPDTLYEPPATPKVALTEYATELNGGDKALGKEAIKRAAMDFFNREIKTVNDLTAEEAEKIYKAAKTKKYTL